MKGDTAGTENISVAVHFLHEACELNTTWLTKFSFSERARRVVDGGVWFPLVVCFPPCSPQGFSVVCSLDVFSLLPVWFKVEPRPQPEAQLEADAASRQDEPETHVPVVEDNPVQEDEKEVQEASLASLAT